MLFVAGEANSQAHTQIVEASFDLSDPSRLKSSWTYWEDGKPGMAAVLEMTRAK